MSKLGNKPLGVEAQRSALKLSESLNAVRDSTAKIATTADNAASGINRLGGVTALTSRQLDVMARTVRDGLDAYRALGQEAPAELQKVSAAIQKQQAELKALNATPKLTAAPQVSSGLNSVLGGLLPFTGIEAAGLAAGAAFARVTRDALAYADSLTKISDRTGIDVVALQRLGAIAEPSGNTLEEVANAVNKFQKNLASGTPEATQALNRLGLSLEGIKRQSGDEQFIAIAKGIQKIKDPAEQTLIAMQLFGRGGGELLPTLKAKVDELADSTVKMSAESVKALDDFGDALHVLRVNAVNEAASILASFIGLVKGLKDTLPTPPPVSNTAEQLRQQPRFASAKVGAPPPVREPLPLLPGAQLFPPGSLLGGATGAQLSLVSGQASQAGAAIAKLTAEMRRQQATADLLGLSLEEYLKKVDAVATKSAQLARGTDGLTFAQKQQILAGQQLGLSVDDISVKYGITQIAVKAYEDEFKNLIDRMRDNKTATGTLQQELGKLTVGFDAGGKVVVGFTGVLKAVPFGLDSVQTGAKLLNAELIELIRNGRTTAETLARIGNVQTTLPGQSSPATDVIRAQETATQSGRRILADIRKEELDGADATVKWKDELSGLSSAFSHLAQVTDGAFGGIVRDIAGVIAALDVVNKGLHQFETSETKAGKAAGLASAGAGLLSATGSGSTASRTVGGALSGAAIGTAILPGIGTAIGAVAGGLTGLLRGIFGSNPEKEINPVREAFVQTAGGLAELNKKAFAATGSLALVQQLLNARNAEQYQAAVDALNKAFDDQKAKVDADTSALGDLLKGAINIGGTLPKALQDSINKLIDLGKVTGDTKDLLATLSSGTAVSFASMRDIANKYGVDLKSLGPKFEAARIGDTAAGIVNDFDTLQIGLGDVDEALRVMKKPINDLVNDSLKFKVAIPENMRPWVEQLERTGQLTDENGDKLTDISGLKFGDPIKTEFQKIIDKLQELIDKIAGPNGVAAAINDLPNKKTIDIGLNVDGPQFHATAASTGGLVVPGGVQRFAQGGRVLPFLSRGTDTVPALLTPGEIVLNASQQRAVAASMSGDGGGGDLRVVLMLDSRIIQEQVIRNVQLNKDGSYTKMRGALGLAS